MTKRLQLAVLVCAGVMDAGNMADEHLAALGYPVRQFGFDARRWGENIKAFAAEVLFAEISKIEEMEARWARLEKGLASAIGMK